MICSETGGLDAIRLWYFIITNWINWERVSHHGEQLFELSAGDYYYAFWNIHGKKLARQHRLRSLLISLGHQLLFPEGYFSRMEA